MYTYLMLPLEVRAELPANQHPRGSHDRDAVPQPAVRRRHPLAAFIVATKGRLAFPGTPRRASTDDEQRPAILQG